MKTQSDSMREAQQKHDDLEQEDDSRSHCIYAMVDKLMDAENCRLVTWPDFSESAGERLGDHSDEVVQLVLAVYRGKAELADKIASRLGDELAELAAELVARELDK